MKILKSRRGTTSGVNDVESAQKVLKVSACVGGCVCWCVCVCMRVHEMSCWCMY